MSSAENPCPVCGALNSPKDARCVCGCDLTAFRALELKGPRSKPWSVVWSILMVLVAIVLLLLVSVAAL